MVFNLSRALRIVGCLWGAEGFCLVAKPFIDVARGEYESPVAAIVGLFVGLLAGGFYWLSRCKAAQRPKDQRVRAGLLWIVAVAFAAVAGRLLYLYVDEYLLRHYWLS